MTLKRKVLPTGPTNAPIAFVGEAPGREEEARGEPFVGPSGKLLRKLCARAGINTQACYLTNVVKERPPNNNIEVFIKIRPKKVVTTEEYDAYEKELKDELSNHKANVIVAVGAVALWALCRKKHITAYRGSILESTLLPGRKVIPIIHPSAALRQYIYQYYIYLDLKKVKKESESPDIVLPQRSLNIAKDIHDALSVMSRARKLSSIAFDIETINDELACFAIAFSPNEAYVIPLVDDKGNVFSDVDEVKVIRALGELLEDPSVTKIGQNMIFDCGFMFRKYGVVTASIEDTMIAHAIMYPEMQKGLDFLASVYTNEPYYKHEGKQWKKLDSSYETFWKYNAKDAAVTYEVWSALKEHLLQDEELYVTYNNQRSLILPLIFMTEHGIRVDKEGLKAASADAEKRIKETLSKIEEIAPGINPNSVKDLKTYFYVTKGYKPYISRSTGNITVNRDALKRLAAKGDKLAALLLDLRRLTKLKSTYFDVKLSSDGRLRAAYNPVGTESGRLSSSKTVTGEGTNLQNQPKEMKRFMLADDGYLLYQIDLSQAENRVVAYIAPEPTMIRAFEEGTDIHSLTASLIFGDPIEKIIEEHENKVPVAIGDGTHTKREWGKRANHGLNYGLGYRAFALYYEIPERDAKRIVEAYHDVYPGVRKYHEWVRNSLSKDRTIKNLLGRKRTFLDRWGEQLFKAAYSFIPQSTVADVINRFGVLYVYEYEPDIVLLNQIHDALLIQIPINIGIEKHASILQQVKKSLEHPLEAWGRKFVIPAEVEAGFNLGAMTKINMDDDVVGQLKEIVSGEKAE